MRPRGPKKNQKKTKMQTQRKRTGMTLSCQRAVTQRAGMTLSCQRVLPGLAAAAFHATAPVTQSRKKGLQNRSGTSKIRATYDVDDRIGRYCLHDGWPANILIVITHVYFSIKINYNSITLSGSRKKITCFFVQMRIETCIFKSLSK